MTRLTMDELRDLANERRLARAALHREVRDTHDFEASCAQVARIIETEDVCVGSMRVEELLQWIVCRGTRKHRLIGDLLEEAGCSQFKLVRELSARQRSLLTDHLTGTAMGREAA